MDGAHGVSKVGAGPGSYWDYMKDEISLEMLCRDSCTFVGMLNRVNPQENMGVGHAVLASWMASVHAISLRYPGI